MPVMNNTDTTISYTIVNVAVNRPLFRDFAYKINGLIGEECIGSRVLINFSGLSQVGVITKINPDIDFDKSKLKEAKLLDKKAIIPKDVIDVLQFGSNYYQYPLGQCFNVALPKLL